jgi:hypothetical protein
MKQQSTNGKRRARHEKCLPDIRPVAPDIAAKDYFSRPKNAAPLIFETPVVPQRHRFRLILFDA